MARIRTVTEETATGETLEMLQRARAMRGGVLAGISQVLLVDPGVGRPASQIYQHLNFGPSQLSRLQREMLAAVVNGLVGGAP